MPAASLLFSDSTQEDVFASLQPLLLEINRRRPLTFVEPMVEFGSLGFSLLQQRFIDYLYVNTRDALAFAFLQVALGKSCANRRDLNWLVRKVERSADAALRCPEDEDPTSPKMLALDYVNDQVREVVVAGIMPEATYRKIITEHIEVLYQHRGRVKGLGGSSWRSFVATLKPNFSDNRLYHFNATGLQPAAAAEVSALCLELPHPWTLCTRSAGGLDACRCPGLDCALGGLWFTSMSSLRARPAMAVAA
jgi:hypothetical protein